MDENQTEVDKKAYHVSTAPFVIESDVHGYAPGVVAEVVATVATSSEAFHLAAIIVTVVGIETRLLVGALM